jgi:hypothetical protein
MPSKRKRARRAAPAPTADDKALPVSGEYSQLDGPSSGDG